MLRAIQAITDAALGQMSLQESLDELLGRTCAILVADTAVLLLRESGGSEFVCRAAHGPSPERDCKFSTASGILQQLSERREPLLLEEIPPADGLCRIIPESLPSVLAAPLLAEGSVTGIVLVGSSRPGQFAQDKLSLLQLVAGRAASLIEHALLLEQVRAGRARSQLLAQQLMEAQEAERRHLARELHDEIGQALTALKINLQGLQHSVRDSAPAARLGESIAMTDNVLQQVRSMSLDLRPSMLDDLGLAAALRWYLDRQAKRAGFAAEFRSDASDMRAPANFETACFRVAQEAITNIIRHARAQHVRVELVQRDQELQLTIQDDGIGFDVAAAHCSASRGGSLGLLGMQERVLLIGGRIEIDSAAGRGTAIHVRFPLAAHPSLERRKRKRDL
ncbi:MAG TPA: ATP-binding protein [Gemmataceae bacterium]|nr:ATP-binding protein [Gemmataceae bacterium]